MSFDKLKTNTAIFGYDSVASKHNNKNLVSRLVVTKFKFFSKKSFKYGVKSVYFLRELYVESCNMRGDA